MSSVGFLSEYYAPLTTNSVPFHWQRQTFEQLCHGELPSQVDLPTGSGKTSLMSLWVLALAWQSLHGKQVTLPRRLIWIVDRRVVVDQATDEADGLIRRLDEAALVKVREGLARLCCFIGPHENPLSVSTLRGEREDNREWSRNPTRPAIVVGTVDMVGSRLLFSGYGDSRRRRAHHAGLLGHDALIVNDEAHLTPALAALLTRLSGQTGGDRPMRAMLLSATHRASGHPAFPENLDADLANGRSEFAKRYRAVKRLHIIPSDKPKDDMLTLASMPHRRTIVFVRSPEDARRLAAEIQKTHTGVRVPLITGIQRGYERDRLLEDDVARRFLRKDAEAADAPPCWLVATSAGEVGINLSADRLISDLDTAEHLLQRFGRLNRFGETEGDAYVVYSPKQVTGDKEGVKRLKATIEYLESLGASVSPEALRKNPPPAAAMSKAPNLAPLLPWLIDVWSMTSVNAGDWPSRPPVEPWLRGDEEDSPPETYVAWRRDVEDLTDPRVAQTDLEEIFDCFPVLARERVKQYTNVLRESLTESNYLDRRAILVTVDGEVHAGTLGQILDPLRLRYATLLLPPGVGFLDANGMVDWSKSTANLSQADLARYDVADIEGRRQRLRLDPGDEQTLSGLRLRCTLELPAEDGNEVGARWLYFSGSVRKAAPPSPQTLEDHQAQVAQAANSLAEQLGFDLRLASVFRWAGEWHDKGKDREIWQRAAGNPGGGPPLAKSKRFNGRMLGGYRHELGSLIDVEKPIPPEFSPEERDLALHLIGAHHGWARPHFPNRAYDKGACKVSEGTALETARRFARLQRRHGAWGLAYLEAIFRSADAIASADAPELPANA